MNVHFRYLVFISVQVSCVRMLSGERVLTASHDGTVKMWDVRTDTCVATVGRGLSAILCMEYDDSTGILAVAGRDTYENMKFMFSTPMDLLIF